MLPCYVVAAAAAAAAALSLGQWRHEANDAQVTPGHTKPSAETQLQIVIQVTMCCCVAKSYYRAFYF